MVEQFPLFVSADEASRPTTIAAYVSGVDFIPESVGGTGVSAFSSTVSAIASSTVGFSVNAAGDAVTLNPGVNELGLAAATVVTRYLNYSTQLSGHEDSTSIFLGTLSALSGLNMSGPLDTNTSASISGCPYPPPFSFIQSTASLAAGVDNFYFGSGVSVVETTNGADGISFDDTNGYWEISESGWYEVGADIGMSITVNPSTIKNYIMLTTGYGGIEEAKAFTTQELRTNIDPHLTRASWMGMLLAPVKLAIKCDTDAGLITSERYSTAWMKRIG